MLKKIVIGSFVVLFIAAILSCGHLKRPFKKDKSNRGKKKGHSINYNINLESLKFRKVIV